ncbi:MAG: PepSY-like domain-containing protein [Bacteroidota bacterium]
MKSKICILILMMFSLSVFSQQIKESAVPKVVADALAGQYPNAKLKNWEKQKESYIAVIKDEGQTGRVEITAEGEWVQTIFVVDAKELPSPVQVYVKDNYPATYKIASANFFEKKSADNYYFVKVKKEGVGQDQSSELTFTPQGALLKKFDPVPIKIEEPVVNKVKEDKKKEVEEKKKEEKKKEIEEKKKETKTKEAEEKKEEKDALADDDKKEVKTKNTHQVKTTENKTKTTTKATPKNSNAKKTGNTYVSDGLIPAKVKSSFSKKFPKAEEVKWDTLPDNEFSCSFIFHEQKSSIKMDTSGIVIVTKTLMDKYNLYQPIVNWLVKTYKSYKLVYAEKVVRKDRNNYYYVKISVRKKGVYQIYFDKSGRMNKIIDPDIEDEQVEETVSSIDNKFNSEFEKELSKGIDESVQTEAKVESKELPTPIMEYMKANYKPDIKIKKSMYTEDPEFGTCYYIKIAKEGVGQKETQLYFDTQGKLLKVIDPDAVVNDAEEEKADANKNIPAEVISTLKLKFAKAVAVKWENVDTVYTASFQFKGIHHKVDISKQGSWIQTSIPVKTDAVPAFINTQLVKAMKNYVIKNCESVTKFDRKNYYYVEVYDKKKGAEDLWKFYFSSSGKLMKKLEPGQADE